MRVLLLDDEERIVNGLAFMIRGFNFPDCEVYPCTNSLEALELCRQTMPNLALVDVNMPGMDGLQFIAKAKEIVPGCKFSILSGYNDFAYAQSAIRLGCVDYLTKPIDQNALKQLVFGALMNEYGVEPYLFKLLSGYQIFLDALECKSKATSTNVRAILSYIDQHLDNDTSSTAIAEHLGMNPKYISNLFLKETGQNISRYITAVRLQRAAQLLINSDMTVEEISRAVGYQDERHFYRVFRTNMEVSPRQFRNKFDKRIGT